MLIPIMPTKPQCLIDVDLANTINQFLYKVVGTHKNPGFRCPACGRAVKPHHPHSETGPRIHFEHVKKSACVGPPSWGKSTK
jgi:hypothetical protein